MRFHTQTAGCSLTAQQPEINISRVTLQALAAVLGGTQSLHTNSMDEALALPSEKAARIALRTQQIIANESGVTNTVDPLAGSYYVEWLTDCIEEEAMKYIDQIKIATDPEIIINMADAILIFDILHEEAISLKCKALTALGKHSLAKNAFTKFSRELPPLRFYGLPNPMSTVSGSRSTRPCGSGRTEAHSAAMSENVHCGARERVCCEA